MNKYTQEIRWGPGILETTVTLYPLLRRSATSEVPIKPVPPPMEDKNVILIIAHLPTTKFEHEHTTYPHLYKSFMHAQYYKPGCNYAYYSYR